MKLTLLTVIIEVSSCFKLEFCSEWNPGQWGVRDQQNEKWKQNASSETNGWNDGHLTKHLKCFLIISASFNQDSQSHQMLRPQSLDGDFEVHLCRFPSRWSLSIIWGEAVQQPLDHGESVDTWNGWKFCRVSCHKGAAVIQRRTLFLFLISL